MPSPLQRSWTQVAERYHRYVAPGLLPAASAMCEAVAIGSRDRVVDIACGAGSAAFEARARGAAQVIALDFAYGMVALAQRIAGAERDRSPRESSPLWILQGDALALPLREHTMDVALSNFGAVFAPDAAGFAGEAARVLKPGGRLALTAWPREGAVGAYYDLVDQHIVPPPSPHDPHAWARQETAERWLSPMFDRISHAPLSLPFRANSPAEAWQVLQSATGRVSAAYAALDPGARRRMDAEMVRFFEGFTGPGGVCWDREARLMVAVRR